MLLDAEYFEKCAKNTRKSKKPELFENVKFMKCKGTKMVVGFRINIFTILFLKTLCSKTLSFRNLSPHCNISGCF